MSATLTWLNSGLGTKTGTTTAAFFTDFKALFDTKNSDANFLWTVASSNLGSSPYYINLKKKDNSAGRILMVSWTSAPAGNNSAILEATPNTANVHLCFFPAGNVDTPSNLTAASGTIMGDDTGVIKATTAGQPGSTYSANIVPFYFESAEAIWFGTGNPTSAATYAWGAGYTIIDANDTAYAAIVSLSGGSSSLGTFGSAAGLMGWNNAAVDQVAGTSIAPFIRTNYGSADRLYYIAFWPTSWASQAQGQYDILSDAANADAWFVAPQIIGHTKGEGLVLKLRQLAWGPGTFGPFQPYYTSGPVVKARQFSQVSAGATGWPWLTNFKL